RSLGMPIAPSLVQVPEMSGCPHGVFGAVHALVAAAFAAGALSAPAGAWAAAGPAVIMPASTTADASNRLLMSPPGSGAVPDHDDSSGRSQRQSQRTTKQDHKGPQRIQRTTKGT